MRIEANWEEPEEHEGNPGLNDNGQRLIKVEAAGGTFLFYVPDNDYDKGGAVLSTWRDNGGPPTS